MRNLLLGGFRAAKEGRREEAYQMFCEVVSKDPQNEYGWLYRAATTDSRPEAFVCLEKVLSINPTNNKAVRGLERIKNLPNEEGESQNSEFEKRNSTPPENQASSFLEGQGSFVPGLNSRPYQPSNAASFKAERGVEVSPHPVPGEESRPGKFSSRADLPVVEGNGSLESGSRSNLQGPAEINYIASNSSPARLESSFLNSSQPRPMRAYPLYSADQAEDESQFIPEPELPERNFSREGPLLNPEIAVGSDREERGPQRRGGLLLLFIPLILFGLVKG